MVSKDYLRAVLAHDPMMDYFRKESDEMEYDPMTEYLRKKSEKMEYDPMTEYLRKKSEKMEYDPMTEYLRKKSEKMEYDPMTENLRKESEEMEYLSRAGKRAFLKSIEADTIQLISASLSGDSEQVQLLLGMGADVNMRDSVSYTSTHRKSSPCN